MLELQRDRDILGPHLGGQCIVVSETVLCEIRRSLDAQFHGQYSARRRRRQNEIVASVCGQGELVLGRSNVEVNSSSSSSSSCTWLVLTTGPMGCGKSRCVEHLLKSGLLPLERPVLVDVDMIRALLPGSKVLSRRRPMQYGYKTQKEAGCVAEMCILAGILGGRHVVVEGTLRNIEWYTKYLEELPGKLGAILERLGQQVSQGGGVSFKTAVLHMSAPASVISARIKSREDRARHLFVPRPRPSPSYTRPTISSAAKQLEKKRRRLVRKKAPFASSAHGLVRVVPPKALAASFRVHHYSSLLPFCNLAKRPIGMPSSPPLSSTNTTSPAATPTLERENSPLLLISIDLSGELPAIVYPWHFSWADFTASFAPPSPTTKMIVASPEDSSAGTSSAATWQSFSTDSIPPPPPTECLSPPNYWAKTTRKWLLTSSDGDFVDSLATSVSSSSDVRRRPSVLAIDSQTLEVDRWFFGEEEVEERGADSPQGETEIDDWSSAGPLVVGRVKARCLPCAVEKLPCPMAGAAKGKGPRKE